MQHEWIAAKYLIGVAGLPNTIQGIHQKAKRDNWRKIKKAIQGVKGKQVYYYLYDLPQHVQNTLSGIEDASAEVAGIPEPSKTPSFQQLVSVLHLTSHSDQMKLLQAICSVGIKGVLQQLQQPSEQPESAEEAIRALPIRESLKDAVCMALAGNEETDREILRGIERRARSRAAESGHTAEPETLTVKKTA